MEHIKNRDQLRSIIEQLERNQANEWYLIKEQLVHTYESLRPVNLIKNTLREFADDKDFNDEVIDKSLGLAAGFLSKMLIVGKSESPMKKILGTAVQWGVSRVVRNHSDQIKAAAANIIHSWLDDDKKESKEDQVQPGQQTQ